MDASRVATGRIASVTVIAPMLDEADHVAGFVGDLATQDFTGRLDVIVADGGSRDGSVEEILRCASSAGLELRVVSNPERFVSQGLNRCIAEASGELLVRLDCHSRYPPDYVRLCVEVAQATGAWNVGGVLVPQGRTDGERAVAAAMDGPFGGIGWTRAASTGGPQEVDTVTFGAFRAAVFDVVGGFDEALVRNQDADLNVRIRRAGGTIVLDPRIRVFYIPRGTWRAVFRQYVDYGRWRAASMRKSRERPSPRTFAPALFVAGLLVLAVVTPFASEAGLALLGVVAVYAVAAAGFGLRALHARREPLRLLPRVAASYVAFHVGHGLGMLRGVMS